MQQKKRAKKKIVREYSPESLMLRTIAGVILIALGVLALLSTAVGLRGSTFEVVRDMVQGLGGILCLGIPVFLIWGGVLLAFSAHRSMPVRGIVLLLIIYLSVLAIVNLLSKIGEYSFLEYVVKYNREQTPPATDPQGFFSVLGGSYAICQTINSFGGALGMLFAWVLWTYVGTMAGVVILVLVCISCIMLLANFDLMGLWRDMRERTDEKMAQREGERRKQEQEEARMRQAEERANRAVPAYKRRGQQDAAEQQPAEMVPQGAGGFTYPMQMMPPMFPMTMQMPQGGYHGQPGTGYPQPPVQQGQPVSLYDEMIVSPSEEKPSWSIGGLGKKKAKNASTKTVPTIAGIPVAQGSLMEAPETEPKRMPADRNTKKIADRMEEIRQRKAQIEQEIFTEQAQGEPTMPPGGGVLQAGFTAAKQQEANAQPPLMDKTAAYKRPANIPKQAPQKEVLMSGQRLDTPELKLPQTEKAAQNAAAKASLPPYEYPTLDLLNMIQHQPQDTRAQDSESAARLEKTLESFGIPARVQRVTHGPAITRFELGLVSSGINVKRIMGIADNIALEMAANGGVRIEIPIPGTNLFGIEIPNKEIVSVSLAEVLMSPEMQAAKSPLSVALGRDIAGKPIICDLTKMPHLLIAGQTGSGKSVCINTIINSILFRSSPEEVRMIMIDPKVVELQSYNVVPHLLTPVVSDPHKAAGALAWAVAEMLDRYHKMQSKNVRELSAYNAKLGPDEEKLPRIVIIIDELADLMLACKKEVEESIIRIAQLARAAGIHMVVATQRPTVDVITGLIKANIPSRIAFAVSSSIDSRTILDMNGAEKLLGKGDMFYYPTGASAPLRVQGCFLGDGEIERVVDYIGQHSHVEFDPNIIEAINADETPITGLDDMGDGGVDEKLQEAIEMVIADGQASISMLQRRMKIGYARAGRLIDDMAARGIVSKSAGSKPREILMSREEYEEMKDSLLK